MKDHKITTCRTSPENKPEEAVYGCIVDGTEDGVPFRTTVWCEHDGRDVDFEPISGPYPDAEMFQALCEHKPFIKALNEDYKVWEATL